MAAVKFGSKLKELRIILCQTSKSSQGVRDFIEGQYVPMKLKNPTLPILIRECSQVQPKLFARFEYGVECCALLEDLSAEDVASKIKELGSNPPTSSNS